MDKAINNQEIYKLAELFGYPYRAVKAIIQIESGQHGFSNATGKIIIRFEKTWFKKLYRDWWRFSKGSTWESNTGSNQVYEWEQFNSAYENSPDAAMKSTSIGMMQIMGFHYSEIGFKTVGEMWDFAKISEFNQVLITLKWIKTNPALDRAIKDQNWPKVAYFYNGQNYAENHYDIRLASAFRLTDEYQNLTNVA